MQKFLRLFSPSVKCPVIGMIHIPALPGTPLYRGNFEESLQIVRKEAEIYKRSSINAVMIENMHDIPYVQQRDLGPETVATMTRVAVEVRKVLPDTPLGVQILACGNSQALAVAKAAGCQFIRTEGFVFNHIADEGFVDACAGSLLRYRRSIDAESVAVLTDVKKKHSSHAITEDLSLLETAKAAEFFLSDGVIVTGSATGDPVKPNDLDDLSGKLNIPVLIGSGATLNNVSEYFPKCQGIIVGSHFKKSGNWDDELCPDRIDSFMRRISELRGYKFINIK
ncbi:uncharacterized protein F13E9.13, mitochondrial [Phlebotomus argentipes]|uniref:uncharacterized protein F13E9.13, mitochondrial n=1 Tax=Phlebotomus argentipes TaxID=94469 RepID=UPI002893012F|nr:uncharacterized protein F13E9.13, mitochondrial [Phlebotomus argentipes]